MWPFSKKKAKETTTTKPKGGRPTREQAVERAESRAKLAAAQAKAREAKRQDEFWEHLRTTNPARYYALMESRLGIDGESPEGHDALTVTVRTLRDLKQAGLLTNPNEAAGDKTKLIGDLMQALPTLPALLQEWRLFQLQSAQVQAMQQGWQPPTAGAQATPELARPNPTPIQQPTTSNPALAGGDTPTAQAPTSTPTNNNQAAEVPQPATSDETGLAQQFIAKLSAQSPKEAAVALMGMARDQKSVALVVNLLLASPPEQAASKLAELFSRFPSLAAVGDWIRGRPDWTAQVSLELRALQGQPQPEGGMGL